MCLLLNGCDNPKKILCDDPIEMSGNIKILSRDCVKFSNLEVIAFIKVQDLETKEIRTYRANYINGRIVFDLTQGNAIAISNSEEAQSTANTAIAIGAINAANISVGKRK